jgi:hypothetical protein
MRFLERCQRIVGQGCPTYGISLSPLWERVRERGNKNEITLPLSLPSREGGNF